MDINFWVVQAIGFAAMGFSISSFIFKKTWGILLFQGIGNFLFVVQLFLLGSYAGSLGTIVTFSNNMVLVASLYGVKWAKWKGWEWVLVAVALFVYTITWEGPICLFPIIATLVFIFTTWTRDEKIIRIGKVCCVGPFWMIFNYHAGTYAGVASEAFGTCVAAITLYLYHRDRKKYAEK